MKRAFLLLVVVLMLAAPAQAVVLETHDEPGAEIPAVCLELHDIDWQAKRWCPLVAKHFSAEWVHAALHLIWCESRGDPGANRDRPGRGAKGLFQQMNRYWDARAVNAGYPGGDIYDPETNIAVSAYLFSDGSGRHHWTCWPRARHAAP
jgi:hypothetical protein